MGTNGFTEFKKNTPLLYKYPYTITKLIHSSVLDYATSNLKDIVDTENVIQSYMEYIEDGLYKDMGENYFYIIVDDDYHILGEYQAGSGNSYTWKNRVIKEKFISDLAEDITIEFLDKDGLLRR